MGVLMRKEPAVAATRSELRAALTDESPSVRIVRRARFGQYGNDEDLQLALPVLKQLASPVQNGPFVSLEALTAIDALGAKANSPGRLKTMPDKNPKAPARAAEYTARMFNQLLR